MWAEQRSWHPDVVAYSSSPVAAIGLRAIMANDPRIGRCIATGAEDDVAEMVRRYSPRVLVIDAGHRGPRMLAEGLGGATGTTACLLLVADHIAVAAAKRAGARGLMSRCASGPELCAAVLALARGETVFTALRRVPDGLTGRERDVLQLLAAGATNAEIGQSLQLANDTVKGHVRSVCRKLQAPNRAAAVALATHRGICA